MRRRLLGIFLCGLALVLSAAPARAGRAVKISVDTEDPSASTAVPTNVDVYMGSADYQPPDPSGDVTVTDNGKTIGTAVPGHCRDTPCRTFRYTFEAGSHSLVAHYRGDSTYDSAESNADAFTLSPYGVVTKITTLQRNVNEGDPVTFQISVAGDRNDEATLFPTGTVTIEDDNYDCKGGIKGLGTVTLNGNDQATFTTSSLPPCSIHVPYARYNGDRNYHDNGTYDGFANVNVAAASSAADGATPATGRGTSASPSTSLAGGPTHKTTTTVGTTSGAIDTVSGSTTTMGSGSTRALRARGTSYSRGNDAAPFVVALLLVATLGGGAFVFIRRRGAQDH
ncbi:MAG TPA: Ig-like domain-containing protein [Acidimicrobiales bacterium]|nr:Ig-like domain-containing protein [Acidimicrobiales bacterium]